ncbi:MAG: hypothetical protein MK312_13680, partial [Roseibacillus sp.]|nr:hypothetical protein [Roseibacillus sp.]
LEEACRSKRVVFEKVFRFRPRLHVHDQDATVRMGSVVIKHCSRSQEDRLMLVEVSLVGALVLISQIVVSGLLSGND